MQVTQHQRAAGPPKVSRATGSAFSLLRDKWSRTAKVSGRSENCFWKVTCQVLFALVVTSGAGPAIGVMPQQRRTCSETRRAALSEDRLLPCRTSKSRGRVPLWTLRAQIAPARHCNKTCPAELQLVHNFSNSIACGEHVEMYSSLPLDTIHVLVG
jgi:hypothetical protein